MKINKKLSKIKLVLLLLLTSVLLIYFLFFLIYSKRAHEVSGINFLLTINPGQGSQNDSMSLRHDTPCFFQGWCGSRVRSPLFPFKKLKKVIEVGVSCRDGGDLHSKRPKLEERILLKDPIWSLYWILDRGCRSLGEPYADTIFGPFKINHRAKSYLSDMPCNNERAVIFYKMEDAIKYPEIACGYFPRYDSYYSIDGDSLAKLKYLKYLYLANFLLNELPKEIGELAELEEVYLHYNGLMTLPAEMSRLNKLKLVDLTGNKISLSEQENIKIMLSGVKLIFDKQRDSSGNYVQVEN
ncbi:hypothetical protein ACFL0Y_04565 [Patescibacteria group bacterium]